MNNKYNLEQIASEILAGRKYSAIAKDYGISTRTLLRLRQSEEFKNIIKLEKKQSFESAVGKASFYSNLAIDELKHIITSKDSNTQSKIQACKVVLELAKSHYETENIAQRIENIENIIGGN